ncbi:DUF2127 domain-containing protein [Tundrisphaera lichenicola]|uniref:DUF2127 domain-containing protein n=1 Tax=Tundrisphaera lichenicola TaxID=2029860 RepID=UPI003EC083B8
MNQNPMGLRVIGAFKLLTGLLLAALGIGLFRLLGGDPGATATRIVTALRFDPENRQIHGAIHWISGASRAQLEEIRLGTFAYATLYLVEGTGLLLQKHWAEYFTVVATGSLIPFELYEVWERTTLVRLTLLAINLAIVGYLILQLRRGRSGEAGASLAPARSIT